MNTIGRKDFRYTKIFRLTIPRPNAKQLTRRQASGDRGPHEPRELLSICGARVHQLLPYLFSMKVFGGVGAFFQKGPRIVSPPYHISIPA